MMSHQESRASRRCSLDNWDPMVEDYNSRSFNSYGERYDPYQEYRNEECDLPCSLYVSKIPANCDKQGLRNLFNNYGKVTSVKVCSNNANSFHHYGFVDFSTHSEAQKAILEINNKPPWHLHVAFALRSLNCDKVGGSRNDLKHNQYGMSEEFGTDSESQLDFMTDDISDSFEEENMQKLIVTFGENERRVTMVRPLSSRPEFKSSENYRPATYSELDFQNGADFNDSSSSHSSESFKKSKGKSIQAPQQRRGHQFPRTPRKLLHELNDADDDPIFPMQKEQLSHNERSDASSVRRSREGCQDGAKNEESLVGGPKLRNVPPGRGLPRTYPNADGTYSSRNIDQDMTFRYPSNNLQSQHTLENNPPASVDKDSGFALLQKTSPRLDEQAKNCSNPNATRFPSLSNQSQPNLLELVPQTNATHFASHPNKLGISPQKNKAKSRPDVFKDKVSPNKPFNKISVKPKISEPTFKSQKKMGATKDALEHRGTEHQPEVKPLKTTVKEVPKKSIETLTTAKLPLNTKVSVFVSHFVNENCLWVLQLSAMEKLKTCVETLNLNKNTLEKDVVLEVGNVCAAKFSKDDEWYRGRIEKVSQDKILVYFLDYGNSEDMAKDQLAVLPSKCFSLPAQAIRCKIVNNKFSVEVALEKILWIEASSFVDGIYLVDVHSDYDTDSGPKSELVNKTCAEPLLEQSFPLNTFLDHIKILDELKICITNVESGNIWGHLLLKDRLDDLITLFAEISNVGNSLEDTSKPTKENDIILARSSADNEWYRGVIIQEMPNGKKKVFYIDYGNMEEVIDVKCVPDDIRNLPSPLVHGYISDINKSKAPNFLVDDTINFVAKSRKGGCVSGEIVTSTKAPVAKAILSPWYKIISIKATACQNRCKDEPVVVSKSLPHEKQIAKVASHCLEVGPLYNVLLLFADDACIYVGLKKFLEQFSELSVKINSSSNACGDSYFPQLGEIVCAKYCGDDSWYRAEVLEHFGNYSYKVHFIDYGNKETIPSKNIRAYSHDVNFPRFAVEVSLKSNVRGLENIQPYLNQELLMRVVGNEMEPIEVEFFDLEGQPLFTKTDEIGGTRLSTNLDDCQELKNAKSLENEPQCVPSPCKLQCEKLTINAMEKVIVLHINSIEKVIYVTLFKRYEDLAQLIRDMTEHCMTTKAASYKPSLGELVCAKFSEDNNWYRAEITQVDTKNVHVVFVDFGNSSIESMENIRPFPTEFSAPPIFAIPVTVDGSVSLLETYLNRPLNMKVSDNRKPPFPVEFYDLEQKPLFQNSINATAPQWKEDKVDESKSFPSESSAMVTSKEESFFRCSDLKTITFPLGAIKLTVVSVLSPEVIFCTLIEKENLTAMADLCEEINKYCNTLADSSYKPRRAEMCLAKYIDGYWYRAAGLEENGDKFQVIFVDYGNVEMVSSCNLRPIDARFMNIPQMAVHCSLSNLVKRHEWPTQVCEALKKLLPLNMIVDAIVLEKKDDYYIIEIPSLKQALCDSGITAAADQVEDSVECSGESDEEYLQRLVREKEEEIQRLKESLKKKSH